MYNKYFRKLSMVALTFISLLLSHQSMASSSIDVNVNGSSITAYYSGSASEGTISITVALPDDNTVTESASINGQISVDISSAGDGVYRYSVVAVDKSADDEEGYVTTKEQDSFEKRNGVIQSESTSPLGSTIKNYSQDQSLLAKLAGSLLDLVIPIASAQLTASSVEPEIDFDDTNDTGVETRMWSSLSGSNNRFGIWDLQNDGYILGQEIIGFNSLGDSHRSLYVGTTGNVSFADNSAFIGKSSNHLGLGTITPLDSLHISDADPAIRLEDTDGVTWGINNNSNSSTFDIANITAGNSIVRIESDAPANSLVVDGDGVRLDQGIDATFAPDDTLLVGGELTVAGEFNGAGNPKFLVEDTSATFGPKRLLELKNNGEPQLRFTNTAISPNQGWVLNSNGINNFKIDRTDGPGTDVLVDQSGSMTVRGTVRANGVLLTSARSTKTDFEEVNEASILDKLANLEVMEWRYIEGPKRVHIGPMAEDFHQAFGLGNDKQIDIIDMNGVLVASNQALNAKVNQQAGHIQQLETRLSAVESQQARLGELEELVASLLQNKDSLAGISAVSY